MHLIFLSLIISFIFGQHSSVSVHSAPILETSPADLSFNFETATASIVLPNLENLYHFEIQAERNLDKVASFQVQKNQLNQQVKAHKHSVLANVKTKLKNLQKSPKKNKLANSEISKNQTEKSSLSVVSEVQTTPKKQSSLKKITPKIPAKVASLQSPVQIVPEVAENWPVESITVPIISIEKSEVQIIPPSPEIEKPVQVVNPIVDSIVAAPIVETVIPAPVVKKAPASDLTNLIISKCQEIGCDSTKMLKVMQCESGGRNVTGTWGHIGPFQFTQQTFYGFAKQYRLGQVDIWNTTDQVEVATRMFAQGLGRQHWSCY